MGSEGMSLVRDRINYILCTMFLLGCSAPTLNYNKDLKIAICNLEGFKGFSKTVEGPIVLDLGAYITISIKHKSTEETVELSVLKKRCSIAKPITK